MSSKNLNIQLTEIKKHYKQLEPYLGYEEINKEEMSKILNEKKAIATKINKLCREKPSEEIVTEIMTVSLKDSFLI